MSSKIRGRNEGSIFQRPNGFWRAQVSIGGNRLSFSGNTRKEVQEWLKKTIAQVDDSLTYHGANTTL